MTNTHRARDALIKVGHDYPDAWAQAESFRSGRGPGFDWPDWCYLPLAGSYAVVSNGGPSRLSLDKIADVKRENWGMYEGRMVCCDYGVSNLLSCGMTAGTIAAKWWALDAYGFVPKGAN
jgi:hypothetical protein